MDITKNFHKGADTSIEAYESTVRNNSAKHRQMILLKIEEVGSATCNEIEQLLNLTHQTASARISELSRDKKIIDTKERRATRSGCLARVYKVIPTAVEEIL